MGQNHKPNTKELEQKLLELKQENLHLKRKLEVKCNDGYMNNREILYLFCSWLSLKGCKLSFDKDQTMLKLDTLLTNFCDINGLKPISKEYPELAINFTKRVKNELTTSK